MKKVFFELVRYVFVGGAATAVDYGSYYLLTRGLAMGALAANPLAYLAGNFVSFTGHHFVTFRSSGKPLGEYVRFVIVTAVGLGISQIVVWLLLGLHTHDLIAKAASVVISGLFNYLANRFWTFRTLRRP
jgi:putative flippase GtrA